MVEDAIASNLKPKWTSNCKPQSLVLGCFDFHTFFRGNNSSSPKVDIWTGGICCDERSNITVNTDDSTNCTETNTNDGGDCDVSSVERSEKSLSEHIIMDDITEYHGNDRAVNLAYNSCVLIEEESAVRDEQDHVHDAAWISLIDETISFEAEEDDLNDFPDFINDPTLSYSYSFSFSDDDDCKNGCNVERSNSSGFEVANEQFLHNDDEDCFIEVPKDVNIYRRDEYYEQSDMENMNIGEQSILRGEEILREEHAAWMSLLDNIKVTYDETAESDLESEISFKLSTFSDDDDLMKESEYALQPRISREHDVFKGGDNNEELSDSDSTSESSDCSFDANDFVEEDKTQPCIPNPERRKKKVPKLETISETYEEYLASSFMSSTS